MRSRDRLAKLEERIGDGCQDCRESGTRIEVLPPRRFGDPEPEPEPEEEVCQRCGRRWRNQLITIKGPARRGGDSTTREA